jgi:mRNA-degrading endonuclease RelE of RelBE toxin-antitoxin system
MQFLTKQQIKDKVDTFLMDNDQKCRIMFTEDYDKEMIVIGQPIERIISKHQTFLNTLSDNPIDEHKQALIEAHQHDKDVRQGNFRR